MRSLPFADLDEIVGPSRALILSPHPDDESLGCGGLIAEACSRNIRPVVVFVTDGAKSHPSSASFPPCVLTATRESEARSALNALGLSALGLSSDVNIRFLRLPDAAAPHEGPAFENAVALIAAIAQESRCGSICAPWQHDPHCDHLAAHRMAAEVARLLCIRHVAYPVWGWLLNPSAWIEEKVRGRRMDVRRHLVAKKLAIAAHASQHGKLISDDPNGFCLPRELLAICTLDYEVYLEQ